LLNNCTLSEAHISLHHQFDVPLSAFQISLGQLIYPTTLTSICPEVIVVISVIKRNLHWFTFLLRQPPEVPSEHSLY
jgi:hypothetical protein